MRGATCLLQLQLFRIGVSWIRFHGGGDVVSGGGDVVSGGGDAGCFVATADAAASVVGVVDFQIR